MTYKKLVVLVIAICFATFSLAQAENEVKSDIKKVMTESTQIKYCR